MVTLAQIREQYPQYNDVDDVELASALHSKYYSDIPFEQFSSQIGLESSFGRPSLQGAIEAIETGRDKDYKFDPRVPALSGLAAAAISNIPGVRVGSVAGKTAKGLIEGTLSGTGGEVVRDITNNSPMGQAAAFGAEMALGAGPSIFGEFVGRSTPAMLGATFGYQKGKATQAIVGRSESDLAVREANFGKQVMKEGVATTITQDQTRSVLSRDLANRYKIMVADNQTPSDAVRNTIRDTIALEGAANRPMLESPEFKALLLDLEEGVRTGIVKRQDVKTIKSLLSGQTSTMPQIQQKFSERVINTIQQATPEWNGVKISDDASRFTRKALDDYLSRISKERLANNQMAVPTYSNLKAIESQEFVAKAVDSIPVVLSDKFRGEAAEAALKNIHKTPEGQQAYRVALASYFKELEPSRVLKEWTRLEDDLIRYKTLPLEDIYRLKRGASELAKRTNKSQVAADISSAAFKRSIISGLIPAEFAQMQLEEAKAAEALAPFSM